MQRVLECLICLNVFHPTNKVPKSLTCGHSFCSGCLTNVIKGSSIVCPKCRTSCHVPHGQTEKLPTNYSLLEMLDTACKECYDQTWVKHCNHCQTNLCQSCIQKHPNVSQSSLKDDLQSLDKQLTEIYEKVSNDNVIDEITKQGETVITEINQTYQQYIQQLQQIHQQKLSQARGQIDQQCEDYFTWRDQFNVLMSTQGVS